MFVESKDIIKVLMDYRYLNWSKARISSGTTGSFLKAYDDTTLPKKYYKLSNFDIDKGIIGHECINEIIVQRLMDLLGIDHLNYKLIHACIVIDNKEYETYMCESLNFKDIDEAKIPFEDFYMAEKLINESPLEFVKRFGWENKIYGMLVVDYLVLNRDRHGANVEILRNGKLKTLKMAPLFDQGLSLLCTCYDKASLDAFDVMNDIKVQSFIGGNSAFRNLDLVPKDFLKKLPDITKSIDDLFIGLDGILDKVYCEKIKEMILRRWNYLDSLRN